VNENFNDSFDLRDFGFVLFDRRRDVFLGTSAQAGDRIC